MVDVFCATWKRAQSMSAWMPLALCERAGNKLHPSGKNTSDYQTVRSIIDNVAPGTVIITETNVPIKTTLLTLATAMTKRIWCTILAAAAGVTCGAKTERRGAVQWAQSLSVPSGKTTWFNFLALTMASG